MLIESAREIGRAVFDEAYLARLRAGDDDTARHFDGHFRRLVRLQLWGRFSPDRVSELVDDVMAAVIEKVMSGEPREAACLATCVAFAPTFKRGKSRVMRNMRWWI